MRTLGWLLLAVVTFGLGLWASPLLEGLTRQPPKGRGVQCLADGKVCVGMRFENVEGRLEDRFGGLIGAYCGFDRPGEGAEPYVSLGPLIGGGCGSTRYVAQFSDGNYLTNLWVDGGVIVRLDQYPRHAIDL